MWMRMVCLLWAFFPLSAAAQLTPLNAPLKEAWSTRITVRYDGAAVKAGKGQLKPEAGEYSYHLFLPPDYASDPKELFPAIFLHLPSGNASVGKLKELASKRRYLVAGLVEAKAGAWEVSSANFLAAHDDLVQRCRVAEGFKYATGVAIGAKSATLFSELRPGFGGVFCQGGGLWPEYAHHPHNPAIGVVLLSSHNARPVADALNTYKLIPPTRGLYTILSEGAVDSAASEEQIDQAFDWLEQWSYFGAPTQKEALPMYQQYYRKLQALAGQAGGDFEKYDALDQAAKFAELRGLAKERAIADQLAAQKKTLAALATTPSVKKELAARSAFQKVADADYLARRSAAGDATRHRRLVGEAADAYRNVARRYENTVYGDKATRFARRCEAEALAGSKPASVRN